MEKKTLAALLILVSAAYGATVFMYERERNYPEIMAVTGATPLALTELVPAGISLNIEGMVKQPYHFTGSALRALASVTLRIKEVSPEGKFMGAYMYTGIPLYHLMEGIVPKKPDEAGFPRPTDLLVTFTSASGARSSFSYGELAMADDRYPVTLAFHRKPLIPKKNPETYSDNLYPENILGLRLICPRDSDTSRFLDQVVSITFGVYAVPDHLLPSWKEKFECSSHSISCISKDEEWPASFDGLEIVEIDDWIRIGHTVGFKGISTGRGYPARSFLRRNFPGCGSGQDFILVACDGFRALFSGPEIFLNEEGESLLLLTETDGKEAVGGLSIAPLKDFFVDRGIRSISHIVMVDRE